MSVRRRIFGWLVAALALLCCAGLIQLPRAYTQRAGEQLLNGYYPRPAIEGMLAEQAQEIPIAYALYQKRYLGADSFYPDFGGEFVPQQSQNGEGELEIFANLMGELMDAQVLYAGNADEILQILSSGKPDAISYPESAGFYRFVLATEDRSDTENSYREAAVLLHERTGKITELKLMGFSVSENAEQLLKAYIRYLEADELNDWQASPGNTVDKALYWSPTGQLYLYCAVKEDTFSFGALSLPDEEVEKFFRQ